MNNDIETAQQAVSDALGTLRKTLTHYKKTAGTPPLFLHDKCAALLPAEALTTCRVFANRHQMMKTLIKGGIGGEVGVQHGHFSRFLLDEIQPTTLHLFDLSDALLRDDIRDDPRTNLHLGDSSSVLMRQPDQSFDWLYIDGDHSYEGVRKDAEAALVKIRPGGIIAFNDYTPWSPGEAIPYGIMACVNELVNEGLDMIGVALTPNGYFDVALRAR
jgi:hypothetical protein